jgi:hypothetical protein
VTLVGETLQVAPVGTPLHENVIRNGKPPEIGTRESVLLLPVDAPAVTVIPAAVSGIVKSKTETASDDTVVAAPSPLPPG